MRDALAHLGQRWRQSLQLRVVTTTMLLGLLVVSALGGVLYQQIARGLESDKIDTSQSEALALAAQAQTTWDNSTATSVDDLDQAARDIMTRLLAAPGSNPSRYVVMSRSVANESDIVLATLRSGVLDLSEVSPELQTAVAASPDLQQIQMSEVTVGGQDLPAVIIGSVVIGVAPAKRPRTPSGPPRPPRRTRGAGSRTHRTARTPARPRPGHNTSASSPGPHPAMRRAG